MPTLGWCQEGECRLLWQSHGVSGKWTGLQNEDRPALSGHERRTGTAAGSQGGGETDVRMFGSDWPAGSIVEALSLRHSPLPSTLRSLPSISPLLKTRNGYTNPPQKPHGDSCHRSIPPRTTGSFSGAVSSIRGRSCPKRWVWHICLGCLVFQSSLRNGCSHCSHYKSLLSGCPGWTTLHYLVYTTIRDLQPGHPNRDG